MKWAAVSLVVLALSCEARAEDPGQGYGVGMRSCAQFAKDYATNPATTEGLYFLWAQGYMSAFNLSLAANTGAYYDFSRGDAVSYKLHIRSYCNAHPLTQYAIAIMDLLKSLPTKVAKSK